MLAPLAALFYASGFSALIYQVLWVRLLGLVFGVTLYAASTVLAAFMAGLAAGSWLGSRLAPRLSPAAALEAYAVMELAVIACALALPPDSRRCSRCSRGPTPTARAVRASRPCA